jgi:hypothetical protein
MMCVSVRDLRVFGSIRAEQQDKTKVAMFINLSAFLDVKLSRYANVAASTSTIPDAAADEVARQHPLESSNQFFRPAAMVPLLLSSFGSSSPLVTM